MEGFCETCKHDNDEPGGLICGPCLDAYWHDDTSPGWTPVEPSENRTVTEEHSCEDCKYDNLSFKDWPCRSCNDQDHLWEPSENRTVPSDDAQVPEISDPVDHPGHYTSLPLEAIQTIRLALTEVYGEDGFRAYCFGNELKYRLRAGFKGDPQEDIGKALKYAEFRKGNFGHS